MGKKLLICSLVAVLFLIFNSSKTYAVENDFGSWNTIYLNTPITDKLKANVEIGGKFNDDLPNSFVVRPAVGWELLDGLTLWQGYAYYDSGSLGDAGAAGAFLDENRIWQQVQYSKEFSKLLFTTRARLEERFFRETDSDDFSFRGRFLARLMYPLGQSTKWFLLASDDIFFNFNDALFGLESDGYSQNRALFGLHYRLNDNAAIEAGYQLLHVNFPSVIGDVLNHGVVVNVFLQTPQIKGTSKGFTLPPL